MKYYKELGLFAEELPLGMAISDIWKVIG